MKKLVILSLIYCYVGPAAAESNLAAQLRKAQPMSSQDAETLIDQVFSAVRSELKEGREVKLQGFGKFHIQERQARTARNPRTGEPVQVPAKRYARFQASEALKDSLNPIVSIAAESPKADETTKSALETKAATGKSK
ncbi:HU family DNA-binding protein [bacterium]|nr:HU family DNA-binding protein [bacterium]